MSSANASNSRAWTYFPYQSLKVILNYLGCDDTNTVPTDLVYSNVLRLKIVTKIQGTATVKIMRNNDVVEGAFKAAESESDLSKIKVNLDNESTAIQLYLTGAVSTFKIGPCYIKVTVRDSSGNKFIATSPEISFRSKPKHNESTKRKRKSEGKGKGKREKPSDSTNDDDDILDANGVHGPSKLARQESAGGAFSMSPAMIPVAQEVIPTTAPTPAPTSTWSFPDQGSSALPVLVGHLVKFDGVYYLVPETLQQYSLLPPPTATAAPVTMAVPQLMTQWEGGLFGTSVYPSDTSEDGYITPPASNPLCALTTMTEDDDVETILFPQ